MTNNFRLSALAALAAGASLLATPVAALDLPVNGRAEIATGVSDQAGWGDRRRHRGGGIDTGDVIAGVLVIGAIAAIAGAADRNSRDADRREARYPAPDYRADPRAPVRNDYQSSRGIDSAVAMCVDEVEQSNDRVDSVDRADRTTEGWYVSGSLDDGAGWNCWIDNDGHIRAVELAGQSSGYSSGAATNGQLSDDDYMRARAAQRGTAAYSSDAQPAYAADEQPTYSDSAQPAYPGGPLPGEEGYDEAIRLNAER